MKHILGVCTRVRYLQFDYKKTIIKKIKKRKNQLKYYFMPNSNQYDLIQSHCGSNSDQHDPFVR